MAEHERDDGRARPSNAAIAGTVLLVLGPLVLLSVLRIRPELDVHWHSEPAHFWLVLIAAGIAGTLGYSVTEAARRRHDARLLLVSLAFITAAGFLGLHALATPGVLVGPNAGFELATPIGLVLASGFAAVSGSELTTERSRWLVARSRFLLRGLLVVIVTWAVVSLAELPPLDQPVPDEALATWQLVFVVFGVLGYTIGGWGYARLYHRRGAPIVLSFAVAFALLAVTLVVVAFAINWQLTWWEWHVSMLAAFALIAHAARREWHQERFSPLYLEQTLEGTDEASILFADLESFTPYSERTEPREVRRMLDGYFSQLIPLLRDHGGDVHQLIGDAVMVVFNKHGHQPDHARLAARAALAFQERASALADEHPDWPRFRVGVNSGEIAAGVVGDRGHRKHDVIGDTVNLAARLESLAPVGGVLIGEGTHADLPDGTVVEPLPPLQVKGKARPVTAFALHDLPI